MSLKKTKIVATISDKNCAPDFLRRLYLSGMNVVRINTAHQKPDSAMTIIENVRQVSDKIAILVDTKGPEIRLTGMEPEAGFEVKEGDVLRLSGDPERQSSPAHLYVNFAGFVADVHVGATILVDDGSLAMKVTEKTGDTLICTVREPGVIMGRKSINVPNTRINLPAISDKDRVFINWAVDNELDFIAHSFVRSKDDVMEIQSMLDARHSHLKIIAKIENQEGVNNIDEILNHVYGIMVARGDLGVEVSAEKIPVIQRRLIAKCQLRKKPVIIATQMLHSMIEHTRPTRAEVSDVANAIYQRADAIMLSGETAYGSHAVEAVKVMSKIAHEIEQHLHPLLDIHSPHVTAPVAYTLAHMLVDATTSLPIKALICDTLSGRTARYLSAYRPNAPIFAKCYAPHTMRELSLSYGVHCSMMGQRKSSDDLVKEAVKTLVESNDITLDDMVGIIAGRFNVDRSASFAEINTARHLLMNN
jgi:pyruvate kinase